VPAHRQGFDIGGLQGEILLIGHGTPRVEGLADHRAIAHCDGDLEDLLVGKTVAPEVFELGCGSFAVYDLGVNVPPAVFADQVDELQPDIVARSGLLTSSYDAMRETVDLLRSRGLQPPTIIGGGQISDEVCQYVGADYWRTDAVAGVEICQRLMSRESVKQGG
jgi:5-methyltetrahydrofolate--homocysteine methyltransferase